MKKFFVLAVFALMTTLSANAQQMFLKPMVGGTLANLVGSDAKNTKMKIGLVAGAEFGYQVTDPLVFTAGALVSMQGANGKDTDIEKDASVTLTYLNIPILANYQIVPGLCVKAGIQPGFLLSQKSKSKGLINGSWMDLENTSKEGFNKFDLSIPLGLSYEISDFVIDARYNLGLTKIYKSSDGHDAAKIKNSVIMLTVGYKIPF